MHDVFKENVEMPVDKVVNILVRLGMVTETSINGRFRLQASPCPKAYEALKQHSLRITDKIFAPVSNNSSVSTSIITFSVCLNSELQSICLNFMGWFRFCFFLYL